MKPSLLVALILLPIGLCSCVTAQPGWHWEHPQNPGPAQLSRDLYDCEYYASITDSRAIGSERPIEVQEFDAPVQECMAKRGWIFVDPHAKGAKTRAALQPSGLDAGK